MLDERTRSSGAATQDQCDQEGLWFNSRVGMQIVATRNQAIFGADEISAKDRAYPPINSPRWKDFEAGREPLSQYR